MIKRIKIVLLLMICLLGSIGGQAGFFLTDPELNTAEIYQRISLYSPGIKKANQNYDPATFKPDKRLKANAEEILNLYDRLALLNIDEHVAPIVVETGKMLYIDELWEWTTNAAGDSRDVILDYLGIPKEAYEAAKNESKEVTAEGFRALLGETGIGLAKEALQAAQTKFGVDKLAAQTYLNHVALYERQHPDKSFFRLPALLKRQNCWPCNIAALLLGAMNRLMTATSRRFQSWALDLLGFMLMVWLVVRVVKFIGGMGMSNPSEFFTDLTKRLIVCFFAALLLQMPLYKFYRMTFSPLLSSTTETVRLISESTLSPTMVDGTVAGKLNIQTPCLELYCHEPTLPDEATDEGFEGEDVFDADTRDALLCVTCQIYTQTAPFIAAGQVLARYGISGEEYALGISFPKNFSMWFWGGLLVVIFSIFSFFIAFEMIDIFMRLTFVFVLMPFFITAWAFPISRTYAEKAWTFLLHALLNFLGLCIGTGFVLILFTQLVGNGVDYVARAMASTGVADIKECFPPCLMGKSMCEPECQYMTQLFYALFGDETQGAFFTFFMMIVVALMGLSVLKASRSIIENLSGVKVGTPSFVGSAVLDLAKKGAKVAAATLAIVSSAAGLAQGRLAGKGDEALDETRKKSASATHTRLFVKTPGKSEKEENNNSGHPKPKDDKKKPQEEKNKNKKTDQKQNEEKSKKNADNIQKKTGNILGKVAKGAEAAANMTEKTEDVLEQVDKIANHQPGE